MGALTLTWESGWTSLLWGSDACPYSGVQMHVLALSELCWYKILLSTFPLAHNTPSLL